MTFNNDKPGYISNRDKTKGSIFIQELCSILQDQWLLNDLTTMAVNVNKRIMQSYGQIQAPIFENQLGDLVNFTAGFEKF